MCIPTNVDSLLALDDRLVGVAEISANRGSRNGSPSQREKVSATGLSPIVQPAKPKLE